MEALDLTRSLPRSAREDALGVLFLARTIDKARAFLPGGLPGPYRMSASDIDTLSAMLLKRLGLSEQAFLQIVAEARSDDDIVTWIHENVEPSIVGEWNRWLSNFRIRDCSERGRMALFATNPSTRDLPSETLVIDALDYEDGRK